MAYFNHSFGKCFIGTGATRTPGAPSATDPTTDGGFITTAGVNSLTLAGPNLGPGYFGFFDNTWTSLDAAPGDCCPLTLIAASLKAQDKQGPFHGGYQESNKSKLINPKFIRRFYRVDSCAPQQNIVHIGNTNFTSTALGAVEDLDSGTIVDNGPYGLSQTYTNIATTGGTGTGATVNVTTDGAGAILTITINQPGSGYTIGDTLTIDGTLIGGAATPANDATVDVETVSTAAGVDPSCVIPFYCDETYYLRLEVKGSPALRFANHNLYQTLDASGGCCTGPTPTEVDSTLIMIQWAEQIVANDFFKDFISPIVFDESGQPWFATGAEAVANGWPASQTWDNYVSPGHTAGQMAGLRLLGAYVDTTFGNCSFQNTDHYEKEPIRILASLVDYTGDPCVFEGVCVIEECPARQGMGFGEQVIRDLILSESYLQNFFHTDIRIREITQGDAVFAPAGLDLRSNLFTRYYILHSVPRYNNPTGTFDNDQYLLDIITNGTNSSFETFMSDWLTACGDQCVALEVESCDPDGFGGTAPCVPAAIPTP